jgi:hypothetical protein
MPYAKLFKSRWAALIWAGGILWTAMDVADYAPASTPAATANEAAPAPSDATGEAVQNGDLAILAGVMNGN